MSTNTGQSQGDSDQTLAGKSTTELIQLAVEHYEGSEWDQPFIFALQRRGTHEVLEAARVLGLSDSPDERAVAAAVLGELGLPKELTFPNECAALLLEMLKDESDPNVLYEIGRAFGNLSDPAGIDALAALRDHESETVRWGVVLGVLGQEDARAIEVLIEFSTDKATKVRDWATFGLGAQIDVDTPEIRTALAARLDDTDEETREEAVIGLALRGDLRAIDPALSILSKYKPAFSLQEALISLAAKTGDRRLRSVLREIEEEWQGNPEFEQALERTG